MTTTVLLIRHGQTRANISGFYMGRSDEDLNETGYKQVQELSERLADTQIDAIYTSPLKRTRTTAETVAKPHNLKPSSIEKLTEIQLGEWEGLHAEEIIRKWPDLWQQSRIDPSVLTFPGGESFKQVAERGALAFETIVRLNPDSKVAIVTHDIIVRVMVAHVLEVSNSIYRRIEISNASLTTVRVIDGKRQLITLNDTSHLRD